MKKKEKNLLRRAKEIRNKQTSRKIVVKKKKFTKLWKSGRRDWMILDLVKEAFPEYENMHVNDDPSYSRYALVEGKIDGKKVAFDTYQMNKDFVRLTDFFDIQGQSTCKVYIKVYIKFPLVYEVSVKPPDFYQG